MKCSFSRLAAAFLCGSVLSGPTLATAQKPARSVLLQQMIDEAVAQSRDAHAIEVSLTDGLGGCRAVAASDAEDIGNKCDGMERGVLRDGRVTVDRPSHHDPFYDVTLQLHDAAGRIIGIAGVDVPAGSAADDHAAIARAQAVLRSLEARIASLAAVMPPDVRPKNAVNLTPLPKFDTAGFSAKIDNPYFPLIPGTTYRFLGTGNASRETNVMTVTNDVRVVAGVRAIVVHDQVFDGDELTEDTYDWYAQDRTGNVWYLGEDTREYRDGQVVTTEGSWETGRAGAQAGIIMWAHPAAHRGQLYRQEYRPGTAEDMGRVVSVQQRVTGAGRTFSDCITTEDTTPLEPNVHERKYYCRDVGLVKEEESTGEGSVLSTTLGRNRKH